MLALAEGCSPTPIAALLNPDLDPRAALANPGAIPGLPPRAAVRLADPELAAQAAVLREQAAQAQCSVLTPDDAAYPDAWRRAPLRPLVLFARGNLAALQQQPAATIVGSRTPLQYGEAAAELLSQCLVQAGFCLWSGLARGVDAIAHRACVAFGKPTVAILGSGLLHLYPREHQTLANELLACGGCLLSELPPNRTADRGQFPRRNRLLAMGTPATLVIEAGLTSGSLHTARLAAEWGSTVFALPGPWQSPRSQGCHRLLHEGATPIESVESLLRDLGLEPSNQPGSAQRIIRSADECAVLRQLCQGPRPSDLVQRESGLDRATFLRVVQTLQQQGSLQHGAGDLLHCRADLRTLPEN